MLKHDIFISIWAITSWKHFSASFCGLQKTSGAFLGSRQIQIIAWAATSLCGNAASDLGDAGGVVEPFERQRWRHVIETNAEVSHTIDMQIHMIICDIYLSKNGHMEGEWVVKVNVLSIHSSEVVSPSGKHRGSYHAATRSWSYLTSRIWTQATKRLLPNITQYHHVSPSIRRFLATKQFNQPQIHLNTSRYPLVNYHSNGQWPFIVDFPMKNGDFP